MRVLDPGHRYALDNLESDGETILQFMKDPAHELIELAEQIVAGLSEAQRRLIMAASRRRGKSWATIKRHAKLSPRVGLLTSKGLRDCFEFASTGGSWQLHHVLSPLGLQVRASMQQKDGCGRSTVSEQNRGEG